MSRGAEVGAGNDGGPVPVEQPLDEVMSVVRAGEARKDQGGSGGNALDSGAAGEEIGDEAGV